MLGDPPFIGDPGFVDAVWRIVLGAECPGEESTDLFQRNVDPLIDSVPVRLSGVVLSSIRNPVAVEAVGYSLW